MHAHYGDNPTDSHLCKMFFQESAAHEPHAALCMITPHHKISNSIVPVDISTGVFFKRNWYLNHTEDFCRGFNMLNPYGRFKSPSGISTSLNPFISSPHAHPTVRIQIRAHMWLILISRRDFMLSYAFLSLSRSSKKNTTFYILLDYIYNTKKTPFYITCKEKLFT